MKNINSQKGIAPIILMIIIGLIALGGLGAGYGYVKMKKAKEAKAPSQQEQAKKPESTKQAGMPEKVSIKMDAQNDSGISGVAVLSLYEGKVNVTLDLKDPVADASHPAHIHLGKCPNPGEVKYPLTPVVGGKSDTDLDISWGDMVSAIRTGASMAVNVHKSAAEASVYVSCGDIVLPGMTEQDAEGVKTEVENSRGKKDVTNGENGTVKPELRTFNITVKNYAYSPKEIRVKKGDTVKINLNVAEGYHNWTIDEFNAQTASVSAPENTSVQFVADKVGTFEYYCSVDGHRLMGLVGKLIVE
jgi:plastocyanin